MKHCLCTSIIALMFWGGGAASASHAQDAAVPARDSTFIDKWNSVVKNAAEATGTDSKEKNFGEPRRVPRDAKPEIILRKDKIIYNGQTLELGKTASQWDAILPGDRRCDRPVNPSGCIWDELGILIGFTFKAPKKIKYLTIYLRIPENDVDVGSFTTSADGTPLPPLDMFYPKSAFPGYIELDGYGVDRNSMFWEVLKKADEKRNIHCGLRDCVVPGGVFGRDSVIYFDLDKPVNTGMINYINITSRSSD